VESRSVEEELEKLMGLGLGLASAALCTLRLTDANFTARTCFRDAQLTGARLIGTDLIRANLTATILGLANLRNTGRRCDIASMLFFAFRLRGAPMSSNIHLEENE
jgi:uncharacterized protein YjbI with pentapeptide repeats